MHATDGDADNRLLPQTDGDTDAGPFLEPVTDQGSGQTVAQTLAPFLEPLPALSSWPCALTEHLCKNVPQLPALPGVQDQTSFGPAWPLSLFLSREPHHRHWPCAHRLLPLIAGRTLSELRFLSWGA